MQHHRSCSKDFPPASARSAPHHSHCAFKAASDSNHASTLSHFSSLVTWCPTLPVHTVTTFVLPGLGAKLTFKEMIFVSVAGLRGSLSLVLVQTVIKIAPDVVRPYAVQ